MRRRHSRPATRLLLAIAAFSILVMSGCATAADAHNTSVAVTSTRIAGLGDVVTDADGKTVYMFVPDHRHRVTCSALCQGTWPPLTAPAGDKPLAGSGARSGLLGTDPNPFGGPPVVTYNGWPLYTYVGDVRPATAAGQGIDLNGGLWYVLNPAGRVVRRSTVR